MKINIGSVNSVKVEAVREAMACYPRFANSELFALDVKSNVSAQPKSLEETINGAINRAKEAFNECNYSFGIESGLMSVPFTKTGFMDVCVCAIYDGGNHYLGLSEAFEFPPLVMNLIELEDIEANDAFYRAGLTKKRKIGSEEGAIGLLTDRLITRKEYTKQAIYMAMIQVINKKLYIEK